MAVFSPFELAIARTASTNVGILYIETRDIEAYRSFRNTVDGFLSVPIIDALSAYNLAIVDDMSFSEANAKLSEMLSKMDDESSFSIAATFFSPNGDLAASWHGGPDGKAISDEHLSAHECVGPDVVPVPLPATEIQQKQKIA